MQPFTLGPQADLAVALREVPKDRDRSVSFSEVIEVTTKFYDAQNDPIATEMWVKEMEKAFDAYDDPVDRKLGLVVYQLKEGFEERGRLPESLTWEVLRDAFFTCYFPETTIQQMAAD